MFNSEQFTFEILSIHSMTFSPSTRYSPPRDYNALIFRCSGDAVLTNRQKNYQLTKNDVTFIPCGFDYKISTITSEEVIIIHFKANMKNGKDFKNLHSKHPEQLFTLFKSIFTTWNYKPVGFIYRLNALFFSILELLEKQTQQNYSSSLFLNIQRTIDEMHIQLSDHELTIEKLASIAGYCPSYFRRIFKQVTGQSPQDYLIRIRLEHATSLLESGYYNVEQVSLLCGFDSTKYFSTAYKNSSGVSPSKIIPKPLKNI